MRASLHYWLNKMGIRSKRLAQSSLMRLGFRLLRVTDEERRSLIRINERRRRDPAYAELRDDHPRLRELRERYARVTLPMAARTLWSRSHLEKLELPLFRADNPYLWQYGYQSASMRRVYYLFTRYVADRDPRRLLWGLGEDGAFGCPTYAFEGFPEISRDLLDSVLELSFLDRACGLFGQSGLQVLDIGAGYGRLAHRMAAALPGLARYYCVDAVAESTFLSEFYLNYRSCAAKTRVVPLDQLESGLSGAKLDLALNIHSFSEIGLDAIAGWLRLVADLKVPRLLIVPNDGPRLLSYERGGLRRDALPLLDRFGYRLALAEPMFHSPDFRGWLDNQDHFLLFERRA